MRTIIAGSRSIDDYEIIDRAVRESGFEITQVISGGARGVDSLGEHWAKINRVPISVFKAKWDTYGKRAGYLRNEEMAKQADALIAVWDGKSKGTEHMVRIANNHNLKVFLFKL